MTLGILHEFSDCIVSESLIVLLMIGKTFAFFTCMESKVIRPKDSNQVRNKFNFWAVGKFPSERLKCYEIVAPSERDISFLVIIENFFFFLSSLLLSFPYHLLLAFHAYLLPYTKHNQYLSVTGTEIFWDVKDLAL